MNVCWKNTEVTALIKVLTSIRKKGKHMPVCWCWRCRALDLEASRLYTRQELHTAHNIYLVDRYHNKVETGGRTERRTKTKPVTMNTAESVICPKKKGTPHRSWRRRVGRTYSGIVPLRGRWLHTCYFAHHAEMCMCVTPTMETSNELTYMRYRVLRFKNMMMKWPKSALGKRRRWRSFAREH